MSALKHARIWFWAAGTVLMGFLGSACDGFIESQVFFPERTLAATPADAGLAHKDVWFESADGTRLHGWWIPGPAQGPVVLFCHGNAGNISHRVENLALLNKEGLSVFIFDYQGYGQSQGEPSEKALFADAQAALATVQKLAAGRPLVVFGRSLGGVAAAHLSSFPGVSGVILESTFTNLGDMAQNLLPIPGLSGWLKDRFDAQSRVARATAPLLFFHGDQDDLVPIALGRKLFKAAAEPKEFVVIEGAGHNDTYLVGGPGYFAKIRRFAENPGQPASRSADHGG